VVTTLTTTTSRTSSRMSAEPGVRFGIANGLLVATMLAVSVAHLGPTATAWVSVVAAGLLGAGLSLTMTGLLGVIAWAWFTGFAENRFGELTFAPHDLQHLAAFGLVAVAIAAFTRRVGLLVRVKPDA
jgi:hypothetical protein